MLNHQYLAPQFPQVISGQILQANGMASVSSIKMSANSSALVADSQLPIIYKCVSDGLGNVSVIPFDISPHKTEEQVKEETLNNRITALEQHLLQIESLLRTNNGFPSA